MRKERIVFGFVVAVILIAFAFVLAHLDDSYGDTHVTEYPFVNQNIVWEK